MGGEIQRHDDRESVQREIADHTDHRREGDLPVLHEDGGAAAQLMEFLLGAHPFRLLVAGRRHQGKADQQTGNRERQGQPQAAVFPDPSDGETRQVCAEHADAEGIGRPEPAHRRGELARIDGLRDQDHEAVDEQRISHASHRVHREHQRIGTGRQCHGQEHQMQADPRDRADEHDALGAEHLGEHARRPACDRGHEPIHGEHQRGLR